jgi:hypothetical protein
MPGRLGEHKSTRRLGHFKPSLHFPKYLYMPATKAGDLEISRVACYCLSYRHVATVQQMWTASTVVAANLATFTEV